LGDGRITLNAVNTAVKAAQRQLSATRERFIEHGWDVVVGASGTFKAVAELAKAQGLPIHADFLEATLARCLQAGHVDALKFAGLREDRRAVFMGGLCILVALCRELNIKPFGIAQGALREGLLNYLVTALRAP